MPKLGFRQARGQAGNKPLRGGFLQHGLNTTILLGEWASNGCMVIECHPKTPGGYAADTVEFYQGIQWEGVGTAIRQKDLNFDDDIDSHGMGIYSPRW